MGLSCLVFFSFYFKKFVKNFDIAFLTLDSDVSIYSLLILKISARYYLYFINMLVEYHYLLVR